VKGTQIPVEIGCGSFTEEDNCVLSLFVQRPWNGNGMNVNMFLC